MTQQVDVIRQNMTSGETKIKVISPYNPAFVAGAKNLQGKFNTTTKAWYFDLRDEENVKALCRKHYGTDGSPTEMVTLRCKVVSEWSESAGSLMLAGRPIARASGRDSGARLGDGVVVLSGPGATSGGSVKNWRTVMREGTVFEVRDVPASIAQARVDNPPAGLEIEIVGFVDATQDDAARRSALEAEAEKLRARLAEIEAELAGLTTVTPNVTQVLPAPPDAFATQPLPATD